MILIAVPTYDQKVHNQLLLALLNELCTVGVPPFTVISNHSSLLARGFNELWCYALNSRPQATHFLMIHADVIPMPGFVTQLHSEMEASGADVLSAVLPLKDNRGLTSTALLPKTGEPRRVSVHELAQLPVSFGAADLEQLWRSEGGGFPGQLCVNSGLMLVDLRKPWVEQCWFEITDRVEQTPDGKFQPKTESEDWFFTRRAARLGAKVMATQIARARHAGEMKFPNWGSWGSHPQDDADRSVKDE